MAACKSKTLSVSIEVDLFSTFISDEKAGIICKKEK